MRKNYSLALIAVALSMITACQGKQAKIKATQAELDKLQAQYEPLYAQYQRDCLNGPMPPMEQVNARRQLCDQENERMAPLGQKIALLQQQLIAQQQQ